MTIPYDNRRFRSIANSETGEIGSETILHFHQNGDVVWAEYGGGEIVRGTLIANVLPDDSLARDVTVDLRRSFFRRVCHRRNTR